MRAEEPVRHLLGMRELDEGAIRALLDLAADLRDQVRGRPRLDDLRGKTVALVFLEPSTRTRFSFEMAARRLGADVLSMSAEGSSTSKGENLWDTARTLIAHGADAIVLRHKMNGSPHALARRVDVPVINAGDGIDEHPTQALLDALTLRDRFGDLRGLRVGIVGDVRHSRVARSNAFLLPKLGAKVAVCGPAPLCPDDWLAGDVEVARDLDALLPRLDVVMMLRIQRERMGPGGLPSDAEYTRFFGLTRARLRDGLVVMHPGPMNRGLEIASDVADDPASVIFDQKANGVFARMAVLKTALGAA